MRLVHLSDLHLGFHHSAISNQRELDVGNTFARAVDRIIALAPDAVLITGDIFDVVRPSNSSILHAFTVLTRLREALPDAAIVIIAGDHDTPRHARENSILPVLAETRVVIVERAAERLAFPSLDLAILAVPGGPGIRAAFTPSTVARYNVLMFHGSVVGELPADADDVLAGGWNYIALGHYHVYRELRPGVCYAGSLDYCSHNIWGEMLEERAAGLPGKGFVEYDLDTGHSTFHHVPPSRRLVDVAPVSGHGLTSAELNEALAAAADAAGIDDAIVRMRLVDVPRHMRQELDHRLIRSLRRRANQFQLDFVPPARQNAVLGGKDLRTAVGADAPRRRPSLTEFVEAGLRSRDIGADIDRDALVRVGLEYLRDADADELRPVEPVST